MNSTTVVTVRFDDKGNAVQFLNNGDGTWTDLYNERVLEAAYVAAHYPELLKA